MLLGAQWLRNNVTDISCAEASPRKRLARPPGSDKGRVGAFCVSARLVFLLLLKTRIRPHSGSDRGKRPRGGLKNGKSRSARPHSASPNRQSHSRHDATRSPAPPPAASELAGSKRISTTQWEAARGSKMGKGVGRGRRHVSSGVP